jgi:hypothetical protein
MTARTVIAGTLLGAACTFSSCAGGSADDDAEPAGTSSTAEPDLATSQPELTEQTIAPVAPTSVVKSGFVTGIDLDGGLTSTAGALILNDSGADIFGADVTFNFIRYDGTTLATESYYIEVLPAGDSVPVTVRTVSDWDSGMPVTLEVTVLADSNGDRQSEWTTLELGPATITSDEFFTDVDGTITNTSAQALDYPRITCLMLAADGTVVGGAEAIADPIAPGQTITWQAEVFGPSVEAGAVAAECKSVVLLS